MRALPVVIALCLCCGPLRAGPVETAIVAAMRLTEAPNYSWRTDVADEVRTHEIAGATERAGDFSRVTMPVAATFSGAPRRGGPGPRANVVSVGTFIFKGSEQALVEVGDGWRDPREEPEMIDRGQGRGSGMGGMGGLPGMGGMRRRGMGGYPGGPVEERRPTVPDNLQTTLSRPHEEIALIVAGATDLKVEGEVLSGSLPDLTARLLLVHPGQRDRVARSAGGTFRCWIQGGVLMKYETKLEGILEVDGAAGRREVTVRQTATTVLSQVGTTRVEVPPEVRRRLGG